MIRVRSDRSTVQPILAAAGLPVERCDVLVLLVDRIGADLIDVDPLTQHKDFGASWAKADSGSLKEPNTSLRLSDGIHTESPAVLGI
jgi:hypothetical protein